MKKTKSILEQYGSIDEAVKQLVNKNDNYFSCLSCHQDIISKNQEVKKCPKCKERLVIEVVPPVLNIDKLNFKLGAINN